MAIKQGKVHDVYPDRMRARVTFEDRNGIVSDELPIIALGTGTNYHYWLPDVGEQVLIAECDEGGSEAFIIGSFYSEAVPPKENNKDLRKIQFSNGDFIEHNRATGDLTINVSGNVRIKGANIYLNE